MKPLILEMMIGSVLSETVKDNAQGLCADLVCVECDSDRALGGGKGLMSREEAEAVGLLAKEALLPRLPWPRPTLRFSATEPGMQKD